MSQFSGVCIGGPRDGWSITSKKTIIHVESVREEQSQIVWGQAQWGQKWGEATPATEAFRYVFLPLWGFETGFWVPGAEADKGVVSANRYVIDRLIGRYAENEGQA